MRAICSDAHGTYSLILYIVIGNNVILNFGCLYRANPVYIAHFYMLRPISFIYIHIKRKRIKIRKWEQIMMLS